jgi:hypothetical protein
MHQTIQPALDRILFKVIPSISRSSASRLAYGFIRLENGNKVLDSR